MQHSLDFFSDSDAKDRLIKDLCVHCHRLILDEPSEINPSESETSEPSHSCKLNKITSGSYGPSNLASDALDACSTRSNEDLTRSEKKECSGVQSLVDITNELGVILGKYMNQPALIYRYIENLVSEPFDLLKNYALLPLKRRSDIINAVADGSAKTALIALEQLCYHIYNVSKLVGLRRIVACAPNDVSFLSPVVSLIECLVGRTPISGEARYESKLWCLEYVFLAWLSLLVYVPFDLSTIWQDEQDGTRTLQRRIINLSTHYLNQSTKARDAAALVMSTLFSRPDICERDLGTFMLHCTRVLTRNTKSVTKAVPLDAALNNGIGNDDFDDILDSPRVNQVEMNDDTNSNSCKKLDADAQEAADYAIKSRISPILEDHSRIGVLTILKQMLKRMPVEGLSAHIPHISKCLLDKNWNPSSTACRKLKAACLGRLAVHLLPSHYSSQRYRRICRQLIQSASTAEEQSSVEEHIEIDERIEMILEHLLRSLVDSDIRVRWASAKSIGRISLKLPIELNEEIVEHILQIIYKQYDSVRMSFIKGEAPVHGGCLALAEIIRNGLLYPRMLNDVLNCVVLTLGLDVWRGKGSEGTAVRDASCYICWAIVRNFSSSLLHPSSLIPMSKELVNMALFDISINCRRAAGAAIQELVGRVGNIPHGLDLIVLADYYSVANRRNAFLNVSFEVSKLGFYTLSMIDNLVRTKLHHPDSTTRRLAAIALGKISLALVDSPNSQLITRNGLPVYLELVESCISNATSPNLGVMHGSLCALIELLSSLVNHEELIKDQFTRIKQIPIVFERKRLFRIKGGTIIRESICNFIKLVCRLANNNKCLSISKEELDVYVVVVKDSVRNFTVNIQVAAAEALVDLFHTLFSSNPVSASDLVEYFVRALKNKEDHIAARRGYALALGSSPVHMVPSLVEPVITALCESVLTNKESAEVRDAQTRQYATVSLVRIMSSGISVPISSSTTDLLVCTLEVGCRDYEVDSRGDVGSWVREVSIEAIAYIYYLLNRYDKGSTDVPILRELDANHLLRLAICLIRVCLEAMELTRARATFLFTHIFGGKFNFNVSWIWRRMFYTYCYEYDVAKSTIFDECENDKKYVRRSPSNTRQVPPIIKPPVHSHSNMEKVDCQSEYHMSVDNSPKACLEEPNELNFRFEKLPDPYMTVEKQSEMTEGIQKALKSIACNIKNSIMASYNIDEILESIKVDSKDSWDSLNKSQLNSTLRLPGYGVAPQCFEHLLWLIMIPECSNVVVNSLVQVLGGIPLQTSWNGRILEQVVADFLNEHKNEVVSSNGHGYTTLKEYLSQSITKMYRTAIERKNCKVCSKAVSAMRILLSHGILGHSHEFTELLSKESRVATNYSYLKGIIKCLQAHCATISEQETAGHVLRIIIGFLDHQYPTLRFFAQSSLVIVFNSLDTVYNRSTLDSAIEVTVSSVLEVEANCATAITQLTQLLGI